MADITYVDVGNDDCYLHLITDAYSRKILGWVLSDSLAAANTRDALAQAIEQTGRDDLSDVIHHSDRGTQYCCDLYVSELKKHKIMISMTEDSNPTDNGIAERVNGIVKQELIYPKKHFLHPRKQMTTFLGDCKPLQKYVNKISINRSKSVNLFQEKSTIRPFAHSPIPPFAHSTI